MMFYAVYNGRETGIFKTWEECKEKVNGYKNPIFKKFKNIQDAQYFLENGTTDLKQKVHIPKGYKVVYTDGSCKNKDGVNKAGYGIYFGKNDHRNVSRKLIKNPTNNRAELSSILECLEIISSLNEPYIIITDSKYSYDSLTNFAHKWDKNDWLTIDGTDVKNRELIRPAYNILKMNKQIELRHINSHTGYDDEFSLGNKEADKLANSAWK